jgi:hypothetical protein
MKWRRRTATRCRKITDIAFSSTCERQRAEEQQGRQQHPADDIAVAHEVGQLTDDGLGLSGQQPLQIAADRGQQLGLIDDMRQRDHDQHEKRHDRQQGVVRHRTGQQQALIGTKRFQRAQRKPTWMGQDMSGLRAEWSHD